jgi:hypothetical protein
MSQALYFSPDSHLRVFAVDSMIINLVTTTNQHSRQRVGARPRELMHDASHALLSLEVHESARENARTTSVAGGTSGTRARICTCADIEPRDDRSDICPHSVSSV